MFELVRLGWRNLWRNPRRSALTASGIGVAVFLLMGFMAMQAGQYGIMRETAATLETGHLQIQQVDWHDGQRQQDTVTGVAGLMEQLQGLPDVVAVAPRFTAFALLSAGERSFGTQLLGLDAGREACCIALLRFIVDGTAPAAPDEAVPGRVLARNLGVRPGDELVVLGTRFDGGMAALALEASGILETHQLAIDRTLLLAPYRTVTAAYDMVDQAHMLVVTTPDMSRVDAAAEQIRRLLVDLDRSELRVRPWYELMPEVEQAIAVDRIGGRFMYGILIVLVAFSVVNSFAMILHERTREFGMLLAVGMRPGRILGLLQWEAVWLWLLGTLGGGLVAVALVLWLADVGIYLGEDVERMASAMYMPSRMYPALSVGVFVSGPLAMLISTQLAALLPALRLHRLRPADALRARA